MAAQEPAGEQIICAFCGRSKERAPKLVAGAYAYICADCIAMCNEILAEEEGAAATQASE